MSKRRMVITLAVMCLVIVAAILIQVRTIEGINSPVLKVIADDNLRDEVIKWKDRYDTSASNLEKTEKKLEKIRQNATKNDESFRLKEQNIKKYLSLIHI